MAVRLPVLIAAVLGSGCGARTAALPRVATPRPDAAQPAAPVDAPRDLATAAVAPFTGAGGVPLVARVADLDGCRAP